MEHLDIKAIFLPGAKEQYDSAGIGIKDITSITVSPFEHVGVVKKIWRDYQDIPQSTNIDLCCLQMSSGEENLVTDIETITDNGIRSMIIFFQKDERR